jgi:hypothetical protein
MEDYMLLLNPNGLTKAEYDFLISEGFTHVINTTVFQTQKGFAPSIASIFTSPSSGGSYMDDYINVHNGTPYRIAGWSQISKRSIREASDDYHQKIFGSAPSIHIGTFVDFAM